jgi:hypothetical protein
VNDPALLAGGVRLHEARPHARVQVRAAGVRGHGTPSKTVLRPFEPATPCGRTGAPKGRAVTGRQNNYVLSGLLKCGCCGAPMTMHGGTSANYYRCSDQKKRGTCSNKLSLREDVAKRCLMGALRDRYAKPSAVAYLRKKMAEGLGNLARQMNAQLEDHQARLSRTEQRIAGLVRFISEGDHSEYIRRTLTDLEAQAKAEKRAITALRSHAEHPVKLPSPEDVTRCVAVLDEVMAGDPLIAREQLRRLFDGGQLLLQPQKEGSYVAEGRIDLRVLLQMRFSPAASQNRGTPDANGPPFTGEPFFTWSSDGCAGRI